MIIQLSKLTANPSNPRLIKDEKFHSLVASLKAFPEMATVRPIVVNKDYLVLGGNMRLRAMKEAGWKEGPVTVVDWPEGLQREFIIKDNVGVGEWDWDTLANSWDADQVTEWGLDIPGFDMPNGNKNQIMKITFKSPEQLQSAENDITELIDMKYNGAFYSVK